MPEVKQDISGNHHQIAGRDVVNYWPEFTPDPDNPNLMECYMCHRPGVSIGADECPGCGHNFAADRQVAYQKALAAKQRKRVELSWLAMMALAFIVYVPGLISGYLRVSIETAWILILLTIALGFAVWLLAPIIRLLWTER